MALCADHAMASLPIGDEARPHGGIADEGSNCRRKINMKPS
jgi:hypothetical protein